MKDGFRDAVFDWNVTGASICYMGVEVLILNYFSHVLLQWLHLTIRVLVVIDLHS